MQLPAGVPLSLEYAKSLPATYSCHIFSGSSSGSHELPKPTMQSTVSWQAKCLWASRTAPNSVSWMDEGSAGYHGTGSRKEERWWWRWRGGTSCGSRCVHIPSCNLNLIFTIWQRRVLNLLIFHSLISTNNAVIKVVIKSVTLTYLKNSRNSKAVQQLKTQPLAMTFTVPPWMVFTRSFIETNQIMRKVLVAIFYSEWLQMSCIITVWSRTTFSSLSMRRRNGNS